MVNGSMFQTYSSLLAFETGSAALVVVEAFIAAGRADAREAAVVALVVAGEVETGRA